MRLSHFLAFYTCLACTANAISVPNTKALGRALHSESHSDFFSPDNALERRKGGGGRGGGSSGGKTGGGSSSSGGSGSRGGGVGAASTSSNSGGRTTTGSGARPAYGRGAYYGGGATVPYKSGGKSPKGLLAGALILPAAALLIMPGLWLYSVYPYHFSHPANFVNETLRNATNPNGVNQTLPVVCLCQEYSVCGCDDNDNSTYYKDLVGDGSYAKLNKSLVTVSDVNGTRSLVINGTLPNGTTAAGGDTPASAASHPLLEFSGYWVMATIVLYMVAFL